MTELHEFGLTKQIVVRLRGCVWFFIPDVNDTQQESWIRGKRSLRTEFLQCIRKVFLPGEVELFDLSLEQRTN